MVVLGSKSLAAAVVQMLCEVIPNDVVGLVTFDDSADDRSRLPELRDAAAANDIPLTVVQSRREASSAIGAHKPALVVVAGWYWLLDETLLREPEHGFMGVHFSLLPRYRGFAPVVWALINGETRIGYTIFRLTDQMDEGPVYAQGLVEVSPTDDVSDVLATLSERAVDDLRSIVPAVLAGSLRPRPQDETVEPSYCAARNPSDGEIDWSLPAERVVDFVRAQTRPYPGAFTTYHGSTVRVWRAQRGPSMPVYGRPGQVGPLKVDGMPIVCCGKSTSVVLMDYDVEPRDENVRSRVGSVFTRLGT